MTPALIRAAEEVVEVIHAHAARRDGPLVVALDGGSGSGKSTLAAAVAARLNAVMVPGDDFFAAEIPDADWDRRTPAERARDAIDWRRLRTDALEPLLAGRRAMWHPFDFAAGPRPDGTYGRSPQAEVREPAAVIVLDGAYAARPELADVVDLRVLVDVPVATRHGRLAEREDPAFLAAWHRRWDAAEAWYFARVCPPASFDLVVPNP